MRSYAAQSLPRLRTVTIKGKEFHQVSIPQPGGGRRFRTFKSADDAKNSMQLFRMRRAGWLCTGSRNVTLSMATTASPSTDPVMNLTPGDDRRKAHAVTSSSLCAVRRIEPCGGAACGLALLPLTFARFVAKLLI